MKITKRQLRRIIKEEKAKVLAEDMRTLEEDVYDDAHEQLLRVVEDILNSYGDDPEVNAGLVGALRDVATMFENDSRIMGVKR